ncbi:hypothetical protein [Kitasatospora sp. NPDC059571]|uniref:hypothetical protein n=1 Tax=Kitasatospora sp. NPDC059571 TaxID=3346871 RepID=UPI0036765770
MTASAPPVPPAQTSLPPLPPLRGNRDFTTFWIGDTTSLLGTQVGVAGVVMVAVRQACSPMAMMGRMTACFRAALFGGGCLGGLSAGLLAGRIGSDSALMWTAAGSAAAVAAVLWSPVGRLRTMPSPAARED